LIGQFQKVDINISGYLPQKVKSTSTTLSTKGKTEASVFIPKFLYLVLGQNLENGSIIAEVANKTSFGRAKV
jgi:hypothetical protein